MPDEMTPEEVARELVQEWLAHPEPTFAAQRDALHQRIASALLAQAQRDAEAVGRLTTRCEAVEAEKAQGCMAQRTADPPQDCNAPFCGCNPGWHDAIAMLQESGWGPLHSPQAEAERAVVEAAMRHYLYGGGYERPNDFFAQACQRLHALRAAAPEETQG